jgi:hypothetical protein
MPLRRVLCARYAAKQPFGPAPPPPSPPRPDNPDLDEIELDDEFYASLGLTREQALQEMAWAAAEEDPAGLDMFQASPAYAPASPPDTAGGGRLMMDPPGMEPVSCAPVAACRHISACLQHCRAGVQAAGCNAWGAHGHSECRSPPPPPPRGARCRLQVLVMAGLRAEEYAMARALLDALGAHEVKVHSWFPPPPPLAAGGRSCTALRRCSGVAAHSAWGTDHVHG